MPDNDLRVFGKIIPDQQSGFGPQRYKHGQKKTNSERLNPYRSNENLVSGHFNRHHSPSQPFTSNKETTHEQALPCQAQEDHSDPQL